MSQLMNEKDFGKYFKWKNRTKNAAGINYFGVSPYTIN